MAYKAHNEAVIKDLKYGDVIGTDTCAGLITHTAVYVGNGEIVQFCSHRQPLKSAFRVFSFSSIGGFVELAEIDHNLKMYKCNYYDASHTPLTEDEIRQNIESTLGRKKDYNLFSYNCQHFANWCRYGQEISQQVEKTKILTRASRAVGAAVSGVPGGIAGVTAAVTSVMPGDVCRGTDGAAIKSSDPESQDFEILVPESLNVGANVAGTAVSESAESGGLVPGSADLEGADLEGADREGADLEGTHPSVWQQCKNVFSMLVD